MDAGTAAQHREESASPPVPIKTYQWEEVRRSRQQGGYPWTHLDKPGLDAPDITAEDVLRDSEPQRSMSSRNSSRDRETAQRILNLESSPGSSRKLGDEGENESVNIPHFSKEISLESEEDQTIVVTVDQVIPEGLPVNEAKVTLTPRGILKRKHPPPQLGGDDSPRNSKCCHPLVEKIKHIADKTIHRKDPAPPNQKITQEIIDLDESPGAERRERQKEAKLMVAQKESLDETIVTLDESPRSRKRDHVYEEMADARSGDSKDPSLMIDDQTTDEDDTKVEESIQRVKAMYDTAMTVPDVVVQEPDDIPGVTITEVIDDEEDTETPEDIQETQQQKEDKSDVREDEVDVPMVENDVPQVDGVENSIRQVENHVQDDDNDVQEVQSQVLESEKDVQPMEVSEATDDKPQGDFWSKIGWTSEGGSPRRAPLRPSREGSAPSTASLEVRCACQFFESDSILPDRNTLNPRRRLPTDHDYEPIEKPASDILLQDGASSTTSRERLFLEPEPEPQDDEDCPVAAHQKEIEDRYFVDTPTTPESRTDCEISTSQVDSSALENLPLKKESRRRNVVGAEATKLRQKISAQTGKLKTKLKTIKKPQFTMPERPKINFPERPKINLPDRPKFKMPERPKFLDKAKFSMPERPKFSMPDRSKFKLPERPKINFPTFGRGAAAKEKVEKPATTEAAPKRRILDFDFATYPRFSRFRRDKKAAKPDERPGTPPPTFATVPRIAKDRQAVMGGSHWGDTSNRSGESEPRNYGVPPGYPTDSDRDFEFKLAQVDKDYNQMQSQNKSIAKVKLENAEMWNALEMNSVQRMEHRASLPCYDDELEPEEDRSSPASTGHHRGVLEEIDNDEFFLRQKGISQDNIEVGKYLSDEIRDAFRSPVNTLSKMDQREVETAVIDTFDLDDEEDEEKDRENETIEHDDGYYTFPPVRPSRTRKQRPVLHNLNEYENETDHAKYTPAVPKRRRKEIMPKDLDDEIIVDASYDPDKWMELQQKIKDQDQEIIVHRMEYVVPVEESPVAPRRNRSRSRGSRTISVCDDDRTSRGADSLTLDSHTHLPTNDVDFADDVDDYPGYAVVEKVSSVQRATEELPPRPVRRQRSTKSLSNDNDRHFATMPRTTPPPKRPVRNYSTLGPSRPPRKKSSGSLTDMSHHDSSQYIEIDDADDPAKSLQSGDVVQKMKDRPLPPPPRPPRGPKRKKDDDEENDDRGGGAIQVEIDTNVPTPYDEYEQDEVVEIEVSTQTDPLPDDFDYTIGMEEPEENSIDAEILCKGLQHFRESSRPSSRGSRPRTPVTGSGARPMSPTAILLERRVSSPTRVEGDGTAMVTEASLTVIPIDEPDLPVTPLQPDPTFQPNRVTCEPPQSTPTDVLRAHRLQVSDLEVERLNVAELQASKILVSEIEGLSLQVSDINSKSGNIVVRGIELAPGILDDLLTKFAQMVPPSAPASTQTATETELQEQPPQEKQEFVDNSSAAPKESTPTESPERPPLPPAYFPEYPASFSRFMPSQDFSEGEPPPPPPPPPPFPGTAEGEPSRGSTRRRKYKPREPSSSSDEYRPSTSRRTAAPRAEPSAAELSAQLFRVCQSSMGRTLSCILSYITSQFNSGEQKKDMQMALVIVLVMIAGLILLGVGDGRTVHHHHWDFFNPPTGDK